MKKANQNLTGGDVRSIVKDELIDMGLDQVPKKLNLLDKILSSVDKLVGEVKSYREEQTVVSGKLSDHEERISKVEKTFKIS
ncbi:hypothetical protein A3D78_02885 [Candidatus Gottesmanbacteria bacterium RIFCSPHIGHO2_02_FULL_39_14]|uniref:Uncharacterized protein n=2 Tax=Candidatus Gottesmaniibacteriota TaxID=1752720 RepID=A0A1F5ZTN5_9BACT|nr:MAG: hypothetical protein A3D78_02885 [Candidatus Gottesmanbacteria bacterium RIFCSPHIGHO2_02_FULL_39_14]OGG31132.1 MAG: hypothetical protein A3I51_02495 [Candidatus Gottesmanbacteria bacterium RIFCSPLOWO2_02_FULL_38_8]